MPSDGQILDTNESLRAWWFSKDNSTFSSRDVTEIALGYDSSIKFIDDYVNTKGQFDGLLGFSQGASLAHLLLARCSKKGDLQIGPCFKFVILFSAFKSLSNVHGPLMEQTINTPSFHVCGLSDEIVNYKRSEDLAERFTDAVIINHQTGHCIPPVNTFKHELLKFINKFTQSEERT